MDKATFLEDLRTSLTGEVSQSVIEDTVRYYNGYINEELQKGNSEDAVFASLGTGQMIAKTVIESERAKQGYGGSTSNAANAGLHSDFDENEDMRIKINGIDLNTWYGKALIALIVVGVIIIICCILAGLISLLSVLLPIILLFGIIWYLYRIL